MTEESAALSAPAHTGAERGTQGSFSSPAKRALDLVGALALLVVAGPLMSLISILVRATSTGPAIYAGRRVGLHERPFMQYKFRSMSLDADRGNFRTDAADPRITAIGRFLRKSSLDELPQLWNVVRGDMSLVGPRPAAFPQLADYTAEQRAVRASVPPGITGLAQVSGRSALTVDQAIALDMQYVRERSVALDIRILAKTVLGVLTSRGTN